MQGTFNDGESDIFEDSLLMGVGSVDFIECEWVTPFHIAHLMFACNLGELAYIDPDILVVELDTARVVAI